MNQVERKPFLPSKTEVQEIGGVLYITIVHMAYHMAWLFPLTLLLAIPAGDQLPQVVSRLMVVLLSLMVGGWMLKCKTANFHRLFGNLVSEQVLNSYAPPEKPSGMSVKDAIAENWHLVIVAALMLPIVSGVIDFNVPWAAPGSSRGKFSWVAPTLEWFRIHSNTTHSLAWLFCLGSLSLYANRLRSARIRV